MSNNIQEKVVVLDRHAVAGASDGRFQTKQSEPRGLHSKLLELRGGMFGKWIATFC